MPPPSRDIPRTQQQSQLPPLQPNYVLRGHAATIQSVQFLRDNSRLLTGDGDGWMVLWGVAQKRAVAVWKAHRESILGTNLWGTSTSRIITHGRDSSLKVWQLHPHDESLFSTLLPIDDATTPRQTPWLLHSISVNTLNFCTFSTCSEPIVSDEEATKNAILIAVPGTNDKEIYIFQLPSEQRVCVVPVVPNTETGMVMSLSLVVDNARTSPPTTSEKSSSILLLAGYESGHVVTHHLSRHGSQYNSHPIYISQPHKQPILSLVSSLASHTFFTSAADPYITSHPLPQNIAFLAATESQSVEALTSTTTSLQPRSALAATLSPTDQPVPSSKLPPFPTLSPPLKTFNTGHSGHQTLALRSDSRLLATAGWDSRARIYSAKTLKELAVLKWHKQGCYAVAFAELLGSEKHKGVPSPVVTGEDSAENNSGPILSRRDAHTVSQVQQQRDEKAANTHWIAVGSKDGNVSLWDAY